MNMPFINPDPRYQQYDDTDAPIGPGHPQYRPQYDGRLNQWLGRRQQYDNTDAPIGPGHPQYRHQHDDFGIDGPERPNPRPQHDDSAAPGRPENFHVQSASVRRTDKVQVPRHSDNLAALHQMINDSMAAGGADSAVQKPPMVGRDVWVAAHFLALTDVAATIVDQMTTGSRPFCTVHSCAEMSAGQYFEYKWIDHDGGALEDVSAPTYMRNVVNQCDEVSRSLSTFPLCTRAVEVSHLGVGMNVVVKGLTGASQLNGVSGVCQSFDKGTGRWLVLLPNMENYKWDTKSLKPENLIASAIPTQARVKTCLKRMFRLYAHALIHHFEPLKSRGHLSSFMSSFKHYLHFVREFDLVETKEMQPVWSIVEKIYKDKEEGAAAGGTRTRTPSPEGGPWSARQLRPGAKHRGVDALAVYGMKDGSGKLVLARGSVLDFEGAAIVSESLQFCRDHGISSRKTRPEVCPTGGAILALGKDLKAEYCIHAAVPNYAAELKKHKSLNDCDRMLCEAYTKAMELAKKKRLKTIGFSLLGADENTGPRKLEVLLICRVQGICSAIQEYRELQEVHMIVYTAEMFSALEDVCDSLARIGHLSPVACISPDRRGDPGRTRARHASAQQLAAAQRHAKQLEEEHAGAQEHIRELQRSAKQLEESLRKERKKPARGEPAAGAFHAAQLADAQQRAQQLEAEHQKAKRRIEELAFERSGDQEQIRMLEKSTVKLEETLRRERTKAPAEGTSEQLAAAQRHARELEAKQQEAQERIRQLELSLQREKERGNDGAAADATSDINVLGPMIARVEAEPLDDVKDKTTRLRDQKKLMHKWHPDRCFNGPLATRVFQEFERQPGWITEMRSAN